MLNSCNLGKISSFSRWLYILSDISNSREALIHPNCNLSQGFRLILKIEISFVQMLKHLRKWYLPPGKKKNCMTLEPNCFYLDCFVTFPSFMLKILEETRILRLSLKVSNPRSLQVKGMMFPRSWKNGSCPWKITLHWPNTIWLPKELWEEQNSEDQQSCGGSCIAKFRANRKIQ